MAEKEIKILKLETLFMLVNAVTTRMAPDFVYASMAPKNGQSPIQRIFKKSLNFRTKVENF